MNSALRKWGMDLSSPLILGNCSVSYGAAGNNVAAEWLWVSRLVRYIRVPFVLFVLSI